MQFWNKLLAMLKQHIYSQIFPSHIHRRLRCLTQCLKIAGLWWCDVLLFIWNCKIIGVTLLAAIQLLRRLFPKENKRLYCWVPCFRFSSFPVGLSGICHSRLWVLKPWGEGFLTKLQLVQSFPAGKRVELLLLFVIHKGGSWSPIEQVPLELRRLQPSCAFCSPACGWREEQETMAPEQRSAPISHSAWLPQTFFLA